MLGGCDSDPVGMGTATWDSLRLVQLCRLAGLGRREGVSVCGAEPGDPWFHTGAKELWSHHASACFLREDTDWGVLDPGTEALVCCPAYARSRELC